MCFVLRNKVLKWLVENKDNKQLYELAANEMKLKVKGFRKITYCNGKINPPRNFLINEIFLDSNRDKLELVYKKKSLLLDSQYSKLTKRQILNRVKKQDQIIPIIEYLIGSGKGENEQVADDIIEKIVDKEIIETNNLNMKDGEVDNLKLKLEKVNYKNIMLIKENEELKSEKKVLNKEKRLLNEKNINLNKKNENLLNKLEKIKSEFLNLKKKYDSIQINIHNKEKNELENLKSIAELREKYEKVNKELEELKEYKFNIEKNNIKNILIFGEIHSEKFINLNRYKLHKVNIQDLDNKEVLEKVKFCEEIWLLNYEISILNQKKIKEIFKIKNIIEFSNFKELKNYNCK